MPDVYTMDINNVNLSISGILITAGGGDDGFVSIDMPEGFGAKSGVHGDVVSYKLGNNVADGTLTLLDPSNSNADLFALYFADRHSPTGVGVGNFLLEDLQTNMELTGRCRLTKPPRIQKTAETQSFEWAFQVYIPLVTYRQRASTAATISITFP